MKVWFLGCESPYTSKKTGQTYYRGFFAQPLNHGGFGFKPVNFETDEHCYAKFHGLDPLSIVDVDVSLDVVQYGDRTSARITVNEVIPLEA